MVKSVGPGARPAEFTSQLCHLLAEGAWAPSNLISLFVKWGLILSVLVHCYTEQIKFKQCSARQNSVVSSHCHMTVIPFINKRHNS